MKTQQLEKRTAKTTAQRLADLAARLWPGPLPTWQKPSREKVLNDLPAWVIAVTIYILANYLIISAVHAQERPLAQGVKGVAATKTSVVRTSKPAPKSPTKSTAGQSPALPTEESDDKLRELRARLFKAETLLAQAQQKLDQYPLFSLQGKYISGDEGEIQVRGRALSTGAGSTKFGYLGEESYYSVRNPWPQDLNGGYFQGNYLFQGTKYGSNIYARPGNDFYQTLATFRQRSKARDSLAQAVQARIGQIDGLWAKHNRELKVVADAKLAKQREAEQAQRDAIEAKRVAEVRAQVEQFLASHGAGSDTNLDAATLRQYGLDSLALYNKLQPKDMFPQLRQNAVVQFTRAATVLAKAGELGEAERVLQGALWLEVGPNAANDTPYMRQRFGATAELVYRAQPQVLGELMAAWAGALPGYTKKAPYGESVKARKWSELLLRCTSNAQINVPEQAKLAVTYHMLTNEAATNPSAVGTTVIPQPVPDIATPATQMAPATPAPYAPPFTTQGPALDFAYTPLLSGARRRLSDLRGKVVVVVFYEDEDSIIAPTPLETMAILAKGYAPDKVVFLYVINGINRYQVTDDISHRSDTKLSERWRVPHRNYPGNFVYREGGTAGEGSPDWVSLNRFYLGGVTETEYRRVTVIDALGNVAGQLDFAHDMTTSDRNRIQRLDQYDVYTFDKDAFDALVIKALNTKQ